MRLNSTTKASEKIGNTARHGSASAKELRRPVARTGRSCVTYSYSDGCLKNAIGLKQSVPAQWKPRFVQFQDDAQYKGLPP